MTQAKRILLPVITALIFITGTAHTVHAQPPLTLGAFSEERATRCVSSVTDILCQQYHTEQILKKQEQENKVRVQKEEEQRKKSIPRIQSFQARYIPPATSSATQTPVSYASLNGDAILTIINSYRATIGRPAFEKEGKLCELARTRALEIPLEIMNGTLHSGLYNRNLPYWVWENAKYGSSEAGTVNWWLNSAIHRKMLQSAYKYSCIGTNGTYATALFSSYEAK